MPPVQAQAAGAHIHHALGGVGVDPASLFSVRSASTLVSRARLGILTVLDRRVGGDDEGIALGIGAGQPRLDHGQVVLDGAQLFIGHRNVWPAARAEEEEGQHGGDERKGGQPATPASSRHERV